MGVSAGLGGPEYAHPIAPLGQRLRRSAQPGSAGRAWLVAWLGGAAIGVGNGVLREATYGRALPPLAAHQASTATGLAAFAAYFAALQRRWPLESDEEAAKVGAAWLLFTVGFEFGFGRLVAKLSWNELLADYDLRRGRTWPLVLAWLAVGPVLTRPR